MKSVISVQSVEFETYQNYIYASYSAGASFWYSDFLNTAQRGDAFWGTQDLNSTYFDLSSAAAKMIALDNGGNGVFNSTTSFALGGKTVTVTKDTVYIVVDRTGNEPIVRTYKGTAKAAGNAFTVNPGAQVYVSASVVYISDGTYTGNVLFTFNGAASNTVIYIDGDVQLTDAQCINGEDGGFVWAYTYKNAIDVVYGDLLSYDIVSYGQKLAGKGFYVVEQGVVTQKLVENANGNFEDQDGNEVILFFPSGNTQTTMTYNQSKAKVNGTEYNSVSKFGYVLLDDGEVKNDSGATPKNYGTNAVYCGALGAHGKYAYNYALLAAQGVGVTNVVVLSVFHNDFDTAGYPSAYYRNYVPYNCGAQINATAANLTYSEYIGFQTTSLTTNTNWDMIRVSAGVEATGEQDVTAAVKLYDNDGNYIDAEAYGLTFTVMDNLYAPQVNGTMTKTSFLKVSRDPANTAEYNGNSDLILNNAYIVYEYNGETRLVDKITTIALAGYTHFVDIFEGFSAVAGQNDFVAYIDADVVADYDLTIDQVMNVLAKAPIYLLKNGAKFSNVYLFGTYNYIVGSTQYSVTFRGTLNFEAGTDYEFEISGMIVAPVISVA